MKIWKDEEVKSLFLEVEKCKVETRPLREAFALHAQKYGRKTNSVRNYYYADVENLSRDENRAKRLGVEVSKHQKKHFVSFGKVEEEELFEKIKNLVSDGMSVRSACQKLSKGNLTEMTRIQNKYQNMIRKLEKTNNVVQFKQKSVTDNEINSLFLGLVRLIKKNALEEAKQQVKISELQFENLEGEIVKLRHENVLLKAENETLVAKLTTNKRDAFEKHLSQIGGDENSERQKKG